MQLSHKTDHPQRYALTNELHARPFQPFTSPGRVLNICFKQVESAVERDPAEDLAHLISFIDRHGGPHPAEGANHYTHEFGRFRLKWERHTEFISYTLFESGAREKLFERGLADLLPQDWMEAAPGVVIAAIDMELVQVEDGPADSLIDEPLNRFFAPDSIVISRVLDGAGLAVGDFRIHEGGFTRFALVIDRPVGARRIGRAVQRLAEVEIYRTLALLALPIARDTSARLNQIERDLTTLIGLVAKNPGEGDSIADILRQLSVLSAEIETLAAASAFRFGAAEAYERIVADRIDMLREQRVKDRQVFREFMLRRFEPAMQTCHYTAKRLTELSARASRVAQLLRTRVEVEMESQNQQLLRSMDDRAGMQLRLQRTVESVSVVAISYYAISLVSYLLAPWAPQWGIDVTVLTGIVAVPIIFIIWLAARTVRRKIENS